MKREKPKMYIVRKYIMSQSAAGAIRKDKKTPVHDCWVSDEWSKGENTQLADAIGYHEIEDDLSEYEEDE